jgi:kinesin family protein C2/C3
LISVDNSTRLFGADKIGRRHSFLVAFCILGRNFRIPRPPVEILYFWYFMTTNNCLTLSRSFIIISEEKLADSSAANAALSAQLENIAPQLAALEKALSESRNKLKEEQKLRRQAEQAQDEVEAKFRESEGSLLAVREECDAVHEELAFKESELEETRLELEIEKEKHRVEMEDARAEADMNFAVDGSDKNEEDGEEVKEEPDEDADLFPTVDDAYVKKLEDELELVTEQLIETEARLSQAEEKITEAEEKAVSEDDDDDDAPKETSEDDQNLIKSLQEEVVEKTESETKLREELELTKEELSLTQEELKAVEFDATEVTGKLDTMRGEHRKEVNQLKSLLSSTEIEAKGQAAETDTFEKTLAAATHETVRYKDEIDNMNTALANAKADHSAVVNELEEVQQRFDEVRVAAEKRGKEAAAIEIRAELKAEREEEVKGFKEQLKKISEDNAALQQTVDDAEMALATAKDSHTRNEEGAEVQSELVVQLRTQLARAKEELAKKEGEMSVIVSQMEERVSGAEGKVNKLESELSETKGKLAEAEANLIVTRREKEIADSKDLRKSFVARSPSSGDGTAKYRTELIDMDEVQQVTRRRRYRSSSPNSIKRLELRIDDEKKKYKELEDGHEKLTNQKRIGDAHVKRLEEDIKVLQRQLYASGDVGAKTDMSRLSSLASGANGGDILSDDKSKVQEVIESGDPALMKQELIALDKKCASQRDYNNQLLSKMLALQGNIQVFCRIRPMGIGEIQKGYKTVVESLSESELGCYDIRTNQWKSFAFDRVWGPDQSQQSVFQDVEPIALSVVDGFNACIFAYGQTYVCI